ncbi:cytochrome c [Inquilinus limosus]|uniref:c-type cytochrome n=1 Tax=Inquilinus limosus TaxID=171674 RepID=UPI003F17B30C
MPWMRRAGAGLVAAAALAAFGAARADGDSAAGRAKARRSCVACHGIDGLGRMPNVPNIAGRDQAYLEEQLKAFRNGKRTDPQMSAAARSLSDQDIADLAAWYSGIRFR